MARDIHRVGIFQDGLYVDKTSVSRHTIPGIDLAKTGSLPLQNITRAGVAQTAGQTLSDRAGMGCGRTCNRSVSSGVDGQTDA